MESAANTVPVASPPLVAPRSSMGVLRDYLALTKPRIIGLLLVTTVTTMFVADPSGPRLAVILWTMLGGYLAAGGAGAINHYLDRERDAQMTRTRGRPLVEGRIEPSHALAFGIVFLWTPPHFWALALLIKDDYARTCVPMLPVVRGDAATTHQIAVYSLLLVTFTAVPVITGLFGALYLAAALLLGVAFLAFAARLALRPSRAAALHLHLYSLLYLALLFAAMAADRVL